MELSFLLLILSLSPINAFKLLIPETFYIPVNTTMQTVKLEVNTQTNLDITAYLDRFESYIDDYKTDLLLNLTDNANHQEENEFIDNAKILLGNLRKIDYSEPNEVKPSTLEFDTESLFTYKANVLGPSSQLATILKLFESELMMFRSFSRWDDTIDGGLIVQKTVFGNIYEKLSELREYLEDYALIKDYFAQARIADFHEIKLRENFGDYEFIKFEVIDTYQINTTLGYIIDVTATNLAHVSGFVSVPYKNYRIGLPLQNFISKSGSDYGATSCNDAFCYFTIFKPSCSKAIKSANPLTVVLLCPFFKSYQDFEIYPSFILVTSKEVEISINNKVQEKDSVPYLVTSTDLIQIRTNDHSLTTKLKANKTRTTITYSDFKESNITALLKNFNLDELNWNWRELLKNSLPTTVVTAIFLIVFCCQCCRKRLKQKSGTRRKATSTMDQLFELIESPRKTPSRKRKTPAKRKPKAPPAVVSSDNSPPQVQRQKRKYVRKKKAQNEADVQRTVNSLLRYTHDYVSNRV